MVKPINKNTDDIKTWRLAVVSTPIGNLEDITLRALRILREADIIAAEDTRRTAKLCSHYEINAHLTSYHSHNEYKKTERLLQKVEQGKRVAVVSDSGTPVIADPGYLIVTEALKRNIEPEVIPGPSALTHAVTAAGLPADRFAFYGFPPRKSGKRQNFLESIKDDNITVILYESVHRIEYLLEDISVVYGTDTELVVIREATKVHEERLRGRAGEILQANKGRDWKGEFVVMINLR